MDLSKLRLEDACCTMHHSHPWKKWIKLWCTKNRIEIKGPNRNRSVVVGWWREGWRQDEHRTSSLSPQRGPKSAKRPFWFKIALRLKKVCYKVSFCENCQWQCCKAFADLSICAKMIGGDVSFCLKFWVKLTSLERNHRFSIYFRP